MHVSARYRPHAWHASAVLVPRRDVHDVASRRAQIGDRLAGARRVHLEAERSPARSSTGASRPFAARSILPGGAGHLLRADGRPQCSERAIDDMHRRCTQIAKEDTYALEVELADRGRVRRIVPGHHHHRVAPTSHSHAQRFLKIAVSTPFENQKDLTKLRPNFHSQNIGQAIQNQNEKKSLDQAESRLIIMTVTIINIIISKFTGQAMNNI